MARKKDLEIAAKGVTVWNRWRSENPQIIPDLSRANLSNADLSYFNLQETNLNRAQLKWSNLVGADLTGAHLREANLREANLTSANLSKAHITKAYLGKANFTDANLTEVNFNQANLYKAVFIRAQLRGANFSRSDLTKTIINSSDLANADFRSATMVETKFENSNLTGCWVYGISAWNLYLANADQSNLVITQEGDPMITVDNLEVAQFIYLLLNNEKLRFVIDTITSKVVLILGRFSRERKAVLDAIRDSLREYDYLPVLFDFDKPSNRDITETISTLAHLARFVIADITDAKSVPQELKAIVPNLPSVPVQPLLCASDREYGMFEHFKRYPWVSKTYIYNNTADLIPKIKQEIIIPAERKAQLLQKQGCVKAQTEIDS
jgi:uncharacterized protein YjbI with pentapeptide repeats